MKTTGLLLNPRASKAVATAMTAAWDLFSRQQPDVFGNDAIGIVTSGSTSGGVGSIVVLSRLALEASARAVNRRLNAIAQDVWGVALPLFHVGGYSIPVRASLSQSRVASYLENWKASDFHSWLIDEGVTLLSLVPTQLFDLVEVGLRAPEKLRAVVIGGGRLDESLHEKARGLGWPILQSFGMTECCSQIATALPESEGRDLETLDHVEVRIDEMQKLWIRSPALLSARIVFDSDLVAQIEFPVSQEGWFETSDRAEIMRVVSASGRCHLRILGREGESVKIMGELVDVVKVRATVEAIAARTPELSNYRQKTWVVAVPDKRRENELVLVLETRDLAAGEEDARVLLSKMREELAPFEVPTRTMIVDVIPRSSLGKVLSTLLTERATKLR